MKRLLACIILVFSIAVVLSVAEAQRKTRDLVFEDEQSLPAKPEGDKQAVVAVKTSIELDRNGEKKTVLPTEEFKSGDKVKFVYTTNVDCYVYWLTQGSSGTYNMLFPQAKVGMDNWIKKNETYTIPIKGTFKFDQTAGKEKVLLVMSPQKIPELEDAVKEAAANDGKVSKTAGSVNSVSENTQNKRKTRDLVFEEENDKESGISTQVQVSSDIKQQFVTYYELVHK